MTGLQGYMGAKSGAGIFQAIVALMPPHEFYLEAFAGSAVILAAKAPAARTVLVERDPLVVELLRNVFQGLPDLPAWCETLEILEADALAYLASFDPAGKGRVLIYADPPYLLSTRSGAKRYRYELSDAQHVTLAAELQVLAGKGAAVIVSGYPSPLYDELYGGWNTRELQTMTRGGVRTEKLWFNFEPGAAHWSAFAGRNFTDRQRIKRKAARWAAKFRRLPPAERQAVLAALLELGEIRHS